MVEYLSVFFWGGGGSSGGQSFPCPQNSSMRATYDNMITTTMSARLCGSVMTWAGSDTADIYQTAC